MYLPLVSALNIGRWTWGDQTTWSGFLTHLLRVEYGTFDLGKDQEGLGFFHGLRDYVEHTTGDLLITAVPLAIVAILLKTRSQDRKLYTLFFIMWFVYTSFFTWRANLDVSNPLLRGVVERFWMQSDVVLAALAAAGFHQLVVLTTDFVSSNVKDYVVQVVMFFTAAAIITSQLKNYEDCDQSSNYVARDFARTILNSIHRNSLLLTKGDLPTNTIRYLHLVENVRPDLSIVDQEVMSYRWAVPAFRQHFPKVKFPADFWHLHDRHWPDGKTSFSFKTFLDVNYKRFKGVYVCIGMQDRDASWQNGYQMWPHGACHRVVKSSEGLNPYNYASSISKLSFEWQHDFGSFSNTSWEKVANDEIWNARISAPFFLYEQAMLIEDDSSKNHLLINSYQLYKEALKSYSNQIYPYFWHKNFALVCEKLMHFTNDIDKSVLITESIQHFREYLDRSDNDPEKEKIEKAIESLKQHKLVMEKVGEADETIQRMSERWEKLNT